MQISIHERFRPFCHLPGTSTILPGAGYQLQIFPCLIRFYESDKALPILVSELSLELKGPVEQFTVCNDLEKGRVTVFGITIDGLIRYHLYSSQDLKTVRFYLEKGPQGKLYFSHDGERVLIHNKEYKDLFVKSSTFIPYQIPQCDRLSLGVHKAQDWELIKRRMSLPEIFPFLHRLGQLVPEYQYPCNGHFEGTLYLLEECRKSFLEENPDKAQTIWKNFIRGTFHGILTPQLEDNDYQGLVSSAPLNSLETSPLVLLKEGSKLIRQLFIQQDNDQISILPFLLPSLPFGRLLNVSLPGRGLLSIEWSKKTIRRLSFFSENDQQVIFKFRSHVRSFRIRQNKAEKGEKRACSSAVSLMKNCHYFFDNFN